MSDTPRVIDLMFDVLIGDGFDFTMNDYADWSTIPDENFLIRYHAYVKARNELITYLEEMGERYGRGFNHYNI